MRLQKGSVPIAGKSCSSLE